MRTAPADAQRGQHPGDLGEHLIGEWGLQVERSDRQLANTPFRRDVLGVLPEFGEEVLAILRNAVHYLLFALNLLLH